MTVALAQDTRRKAHRSCNEHVRESAHPADPLLPFICECEQAGCCATVWMTAAGYDEARRHALPVLAEHHSAGAGELSLDDELDALTTAALQTAV